MDTLHSVIRNIRGETKSVKRNHLTVFREFLQQLDRMSRKPARPAQKNKAAKPASRRGK
jgi:hypothetical protein